MTKKQLRSYSETLTLMSLSLGEARHDQLYYHLNGGYTEVISQLISWANEFEVKYKDREWDGEWRDMVEAFIDEKFSKITKA